MKGKSHFTQEEIDKISALITLKVKSTPEEQKKIRRQIRTLGFYASDYGIGNGYTVADFLGVINGKVEGRDQLGELIKKYKARLKSKGLKDEIYKWNVLGQYKGRPNPDAKDFHEDVKTTRFYNLIYPMGIAVAVHLAKDRPEEYRKCFKELFNETVPLVDRLRSFSSNTLTLYRSVQTNAEAPNHHHDERTMATFLTYHHPELYAFYKDSFYQKYCKLIGVKSKGKGEKYVHYLEMLAQFREDYIAGDEELLKMVEDLIPKGAYTDPTYTLLAQDIIYTMLDKGKEEIELDGESIFKISMGEFAEQDVQQFIKLRKVLVHKDTGAKGVSGETQGDTFKTRIGTGDYFYLTRGNASSGMKVLGKITSDASAATDPEYARKGWLERSFEVIAESMLTEKYAGKQKWWTPNDNSTCIQIVNDDLEEANRLLFEPYFGVRLIPPTETPVVTEPGSNGAYPKGKLTLPLNQILFGPPGTGKTYKLLKEYIPLFTSRKQEVSEEQYRTDLVSKRTWWEVISAAMLDLGKARVTDVLEHGLVQTKASLSDAKNLRALAWNNLQARTKRECKYVNTAYRSEPLFFEKDADSNWSIDKAIADVEAPEVSELLAAWKKPIVQAGEGIKRYEFITFHQSFSYEDFVEGIKPRIEGEAEEGDIQYEIKDGIFKSLCARARRDPENPYALFIDEINRGNVSQIFGELITLIEEDKREGDLNVKVLLPYSKKEFSVPSNLHIIGTMNTADRSVEALDTALRRRFSFEEMKPQPKEITKSGALNDKGAILNEWLSLAELLEVLNIRVEKLLDKDHLIGHSYFMRIKNLKGLKEVFQNNIIPLLQEYFFGDTGKIGLIIGRGFFDESDEEGNDDVFADFEYDASEFAKRKIYRLKNVSKMPDDDFLIAVELLLKK